MVISITDWMSFDQALPLAVKFGVGLEVQEFTNPIHLDQPKALVETIIHGSTSLPWVSMHGPFSDLVPASRDPLIRQVTRSRFQSAFELAESINARHLILHSGFIPKTYPLEMWIKNSYDFWLEFMGEKKLPGLVHIENVYEDDYASLRELIDRLNQAFGEDRLSVCLDIGHVNANSSLTLDQWIEGLENRIRYVHLHNNGGKLDDHWRLDRGTIDVNHVLGLLQTHAPGATWTVETPLADVEPSLHWLQEHGYLAPQAL